MNSPTLHNMRKFTYIIFCLTLTSCFGSYPLTTFYVKNNSDKAINFKASILKQSSMGAFEMTLPFTVLPKDSVLARRGKFINTIKPTDWFTDFVIFPVDSLPMNDPKILSNWVKSTDSKGNPIFIFNISK
jgi:hypothetical protein